MRAFKDDRASLMKALDDELVNRLADEAITMDQRHEA